MICSEVLKLKFIYDNCLNAMNSKQMLEIVSSVDYTYSGSKCNFPDQYFNVCCNPVFENSTSTGKFLMLVMVFSAKLEENFLS